MPARRKPAKRKRLPYRSTISEIARDYDGQMRMIERLGKRKRK